MTLGLLMELWFALSAAGLAASAGMIAIAWPAPQGGRGWASQHAQTPDTLMLNGPTARAWDRASDGSIRTAFCEDTP